MVVGVVVFVAVTDVVVAVVVAAVVNIIVVARKSRRNLLFAQPKRHVFTTYYQMSTQIFNVIGVCMCVRMNVRLYTHTHTYVYASTTCSPRFFHLLL